MFKIAALRVLTVCSAASLLAGCLHGGLPGRAQDVHRTVDLEISGRSFDARSIAVKGGETVRFVVRNTSSQAHDFTIGTPVKQRLRRDRLQRKFDARKPRSSHRAAHSYDAFNAVFVPAGATREFIWWFNTARDLEFGCNVPGHYEAGMKGRFDFNRTGKLRRVASKPRTQSMSGARPAKLRTPAPAKNPPAVIEDDPSLHETRAPATADDQPPATAAP